MSAQIPKARPDTTTLLSRSRADWFPAFQKKGHDSFLSQVTRGLCIMLTKVRIFCRCLSKLIAIVFYYALEELKISAVNLTIETDEKQRKPQGGYKVLILV